MIEVRLIPRRLGKNKKGTLDLAVMEGAIDDVLIHTFHMPASATYEDVQKKALTVFFAEIARQGGVDSYFSGMANLRSSSYRIFRLFVLCRCYAFPRRAEEEHSSISKNYKSNHRKIRTIQSRSFQTTQSEENSPDICYSTQRFNS